jgi:antitoxin component of MazEF toxin-antitoxin module
LKIPILRKLTLHGGSRGVTLPASWISLIEAKTGKKLAAVLMEVNGSIIIKPAVSEGDKPYKTASI